MRGPDGRAWSFSRKFPIRRFSTNIVLSALLAAGAPVAVMAQAASDRADFVASLFTGKEQYENFNRIDALFPTDKVAASPPVGAGPIAVCTVSGFVSATGVSTTGSTGGTGSVFGASTTTGLPIRRSATGRLTATPMISAATEVVAARAGREVR